MNKNRIQHNIIVVLLIINALLLLSTYRKFEKVRTGTYTEVQVNTEIVWNGPQDQKVVALTFDDGPHPKHTVEILSVLKENDVKATFFVLGKHVELYPEVVKELVAEGHEVGNHTFSHINIREVPTGKIQEEFEKTQSAVYEAAGVMPTFFRPPFGYYNKKVIDIAKNGSCRVVLWSSHQDSKDWSNPGVSKIIKTVLSQTRGGDIILMHDYVEGKSQTVEALKVIIPELKKRGFQFVTISEIVEMNDMAQEIH